MRAELGVALTPEDAAWLQLELPDARRLKHVAIEGLSRELGESVMARFCPLQG